MFNKKYIAGMLTLGVFAVNGLMATTSVAADDTTNGIVTFNGGNINVDPTKPIDPDNPGGGSISLLPTQLNFGSTAISYTADTKLKATTDGNQSSAVTTGAVRINDSRGTSAGWKMKVNQTQFKNGTNELTGAELSLTTGQATNTGGVLPTGGAIDQKATLTPGADFEVFKANAGEGNGISELPIKQFDLMIPASAAKTAGQYTTTITWTVSETI